MSTSQASEQLKQQAHALAASKPGDNIDVRKAMRDLTLHALKSRLLTAGYLASLTKAVGQGLAESLKGPVESMRAVAGHAADGFGDAASKALLAMELALREFTERGGRLSPGESRQLLDEIAALEQALGEGWKHEHAQLAPDTHERVAALTEHVRRAVADKEAIAGTAKEALHGLETTSREGAEAAVGSWRILGLMASGALLGLSEALKETSRPPR